MPTPPRRLRHITSRDLANIKPVPSRRVRRAISRDLARAYPIRPRPASHGRIAALVHTRRPMHVRPASTTSGQTRRNHKRNQRAAFRASA